MSHKRTRNHYPRLPEAVQNLLAMNSLRAVPMKEPDFARGALLGWRYNVIPDGPVTPASQYKNGFDRVGGTAHIDGHRVLFRMRTTDSLDAWIRAVEGVKDPWRAVFVDFETLERRTAIWLNELYECSRADMRKIAGFP